MRPPSVPRATRPWRSTCRCGRASKRWSASSGRRFTSSSTIARVIGSKNSGRHISSCGRYPPGIFRIWRRRWLGSSILHETATATSPSDGATWRISSCGRARNAADSRTGAMKIESEKHRMDIHKADLSGSKFDDVNLSGSDFHNINMSGCCFDDLNMSGWRVQNANLAGLRIDKANLAGATIANARLDGATIDGIALTDLLAYWRAGREAKSA